MNTARKPDFAWDEPIPPEVFMDSIAQDFADLSLTGGQISALLIFAGHLQMGTAAAMITSISAE